jgi:N-acetyl sugar amidotransferase
MSIEKIICKVCVMDTSDPDIQFFAEKGCSNCLAMRASMGLDWFIDDSGSPKLQKLIAEIKEVGKSNRYDSVLGLSGGLDSSYLALKAFDWGLRPLVVHVDAGWNTELAVRNIQSVLDFTGWDFHSVVIDWHEMQDLQLSYLKSGIANQDVPQDHAFFSSLYKYAAKNRIRFVLSGGNMATEGIFPKSWHGSAMDATNIKAIHKKFGSLKLNKYPTIKFHDLYFVYPFLKKIRQVRPLNFVRYNKIDAAEELEKRIGFKKYDRKHGESVFTRFFQEYYLPSRFGIDKRLAHFSSQIISGQLDRDEALILMNKDMYDKNEISRDIDFLCRKLRISSDEFATFLAAPRRSYLEFSNWDSQYKLMKTTQNLIQKIFKVRLAKFS